MFGSPSVTDERWQDIFQIVWQSPDICAIPDDVTALLTAIAETDRVYAGDERLAA